MKYLFSFAWNWESLQGKSCLPRIIFWARARAPTPWKNRKQDKSRQGAHSWAENIFRLGGWNLLSLWQHIKDTAHSHVTHVSETDARAIDVIDLEDGEAIAKKAHPGLMERFFHVCVYARSSFGIFVTTTASWLRCDWAGSFRAGRQERWVEWNEQKI